jgi:hypothetical protein
MEKILLSAEAERRIFFVPRVDPRGAVLVYYKNFFGGSDGPYRRVCFDF